MFDDARAKLDRADKHIAELEDEFLKFSKSHPAATAAVIADGTFRLSAAPPPMPKALAAILGDAVNNLRTPLDLVAYKLAAVGSKPKFPFAKSIENFPQELKKSGIASQKVRDYVENVVRPYKGGDSDIWALHDTDIISKHHTLIPAQGNTTLNNVSFVDGNGNTFKNCSFSGSAGSSFVVSDSPLTFSNRGKTDTTMHFTADSGFGQVPIIEKLHELSAKLRGIISDIEKIVAEEKKGNV